MGFVSKRGSRTRGNQQSANTNLLFFTRFTLRSLAARFLLRSAAPAANTTAAPAAHRSSFAAFTRQLTGFHELLVSSANNIASHVKRVGKFTFTWQQRACRECARIDQRIELFPNLP